MTIAPVKFERVFRGNPPGESFIVIGHDMNLETGRKYLFFGENRWEGFGLNLHEGFAREIKDDDQGIRLLDASATNGGGIVYGAVDLESAGNASRPTPLGGLSVRLIAAGYDVTVSTDAGGSFLASNVPPGALTIVPMLPDQLGVVGQSPVVATVMPGGCISMDIRAALNGRIRGRVFGRDGKPRQGVTTQLYPINGGMERPGQRYLAVTNERGEFEFRTIPPGSYLVGHEIYGRRAIPQGQRPPVSTYFPGVTDRAAAIPIVVGNATQHEGLDFVVP
jgi:hypothetical protein